MNITYQLLFLFVFLAHQNFCMAEPNRKIEKTSAKVTKKDSKEAFDKDLHISSDSMDYDGNTNIANAVGKAHAFRYVEKDDGVHKQTIDAKRFEAHFVPQQEASKQKKPSGNSDTTNIDIIKAFDDVVIDTASQTIWADVCTFEVQKDHIDCEHNVKIKDKKTNNEVFGERAKVNLKTEKYVMERGKKQARARIVSNQNTSPSQKPNNAQKTS